MIQPEPYEVVRQYTEPVVTHHVSYKEAGPVVDKSKSYVGSGLGSKIVAEGVEVLPLEARYANLPKTQQASVVGQKLTST